MVGSRGIIMSLAVGGEASWLMAGGACYVVVGGGAMVVLVVVGCSVTINPRVGCQ